MAGWLWSLGTLIHERHEHLRTSPSTGANRLFLLILAAPFVLEWSLRESSLERGWSSEVLSGEIDSEDRWRQPKPFWSDQCSEDQPQRIVYLGGSSTGGAYQFKENPELFFAARAHQELCADDGVLSFNYGAAERDSFTIAQTIDLVLSETNANWIVLYIGHNDFTADNPYTRKEREEMRSGVTGIILDLSSSSRLVRGVNLFFRAQGERGGHLSGAPLGPDGKPMRSQVMNQGYPLAVPLADAKENIVNIAQVAKDNGAQILLVAQLISVNGFQDLSAYWELEQELSAELNNVHYLDPRSALLEQHSESDLLVDNNHLSRIGHQKLGQEIAKKIRTLSQ